MQPYLPKPGKRHNLFILAYRYFPTSLLATAIGIAFLSAPLLYNLFRDNGLESIFARVFLTGVVIGVVPLSFLYIATLLRSRKIRERLEAEAKVQLNIISEDLAALEAKERAEEKEVSRLEQVVKGNIKARKVKAEKEDERWDLLNERLRIQEETGQHNIDEASEERLLVAQQVKDIKDEREVTRIGLALDDLKAREVKDLKEDKRWDLLNERLRLQEETGELASEERLLVAQQVKDMKDEGESARKETASIDLKARHVKDLKEDERWDLLNESLRVQNVTAELASEERLLVAQQVKIIKDEGEVTRKELVSDDLKARLIKDDQDEKRWNTLYERLRNQDEWNEAREKRDLLRDEGYMRMRQDDELKDQYKTLFARYVRNVDEKHLDKRVADGLASIPESWLIVQPEILKNPSLLKSLEKYNHI